MTVAVDWMIVGERDDPHVQAVVTRLSRHRHGWIVNAATLADITYAWQDACVSLRDLNRHEVITTETGARGWIRRLAPADWQRGIVVESLEAAEKTAWLSLLTAVLRTGSVQWLTGIDPLVTAENKLVQHATAKRLGIPTPATVVTNDAAAVIDAVGDDIVIKPLGPGHFFDRDEAYTLFTSSARADDAALEALARAPFLVQKRIIARSHLRVVTVRGEVWGAALDATHQPIDWRAAPIAHRSFSMAVLPEEIAQGARAIAEALDLGYSSQDWAVADDGAYLLDVNPAGQWLFLPEQVATPVSAAIASWLNES